MYLYMGRKKVEGSQKIQRVSPRKWVVLEGSTPDNTIMTNGEKTITWDKWFELYYN